MFIIKGLYIHETEFSEKFVKKLMTTKKIELIPIVNANKEVTSFITWTTIFGNKQK